MPDLRNGRGTATFAATPCAADTCASSGTRSDCPVSNRELQLDPAVTRDGDRILIDGVEVERSTGPIHGIAMDLGTTTVVLRLIDLESGELIADTSFENPQRFGGSEVMSRIAYDTEHPGRLLMRTLAGYLTPCHREVSRRSEDDLRDGRGGQLHHARSVLPAERVFDRADPLPVDHGNRNGRGQAQHNQPRSQTGLRSLLPIHPKARVYGAPIISGHVGADAAACMLAVDLAHEERLVAVMDIGTNTELIVGNKHRILAASCPAGPAFEGGAIACGMPALDGAIEDVAIDDDGHFQPWRHRRCCRPKASAVLAWSMLLSELLRTGRMNDMGRFEDDIQRITLHAGEARRTSFCWRAT